MHSPSGRVPNYLCRSSKPNLTSAQLQNIFIPLKCFLAPTVLLSDRATVPLCDMANIQLDRQPDDG